MDTSQYMSMFLEESMENLQTLNESLLELEQKPEDIDKLNEIFRVAHTIKGMAATMGFSQMAELTHNMENILSEFGYKITGLYFLSGFNENTSKTVRCA